jgi:hypothetical protein
MWSIPAPFFGNAMAAPPTPSPTEVTPGTPAQLGSFVGNPLEFFYLTSTTALLHYQSTTTGQRHITVVSNNGVTASVGTNLNLGGINAVVPLTATKVLILDAGGVVSAVSGYVRGYLVDLTTMTLGTEYVLETNEQATVMSAVALSSTKVVLAARTPGGLDRWLVVDEAAGVLSTSGTFTASINANVEGAMVRSGGSNAATVPRGVGVSVSGFAVTENPTAYPLTDYVGGVNRAVVQMEDSGEFAIFRSDGSVLNAVRGALSGTVTTYSAEEDQGAADTPGFGAGEGIARISDTTIVRTFIVAGNGSTVFAQIHNFDGTITAPGLDVEINALSSSYPRAVRVSDLLTLVVWKNTANNRIWYAMCTLE